MAQLNFFSKLVKNQQDAKVVSVSVKNPRLLPEIEGHARAIMLDVAVTKYEQDRSLISFGSNKKAAMDFCNLVNKRFAAQAYSVPLPISMSSVDELRANEHAVILMGEAGTSISTLVDHAPDMSRCAEKLVGLGLCPHTRGGTPSKAKVPTNRPQDRNGLDLVTWARLQVLGNEAARRLNDKVFEVIDSKGVRVGMARTLLDRETFLKVTPTPEYTIFKLTKFAAVFGAPIRTILGETLEQLLELGAEEKLAKELIDILIYFNENARIPKGQTREALIAVRVEGWQPAKIAETVAAGQLAAGDSLTEAIGHVEIEHTKSELLDPFEMTAEEVGQEPFSAKTLTVADLNRPSTRVPPQKPLATPSADRTQSGIAREPTQARAPAQPANDGLREAVLELTRLVQDTQEQFKALKAQLSSPPSAPPAKTPAVISTVPALSISPAKAAPASPMKKQKRADEEKELSEEVEELEDYSLEETVQK